jgi:Flp pilus assembly protein TadG
MVLRLHQPKARRLGSTLVLTAVCMTGILFISALAIDSGNMMAQKRHAQNCCDAAALAACIELSKTLAAGNTATQSALQTVAQTSSTNNGFTDGSNNVSVTLNYPPSGSVNFNNNLKSVEVVMTFTYNNFVVNGSNSITVRSVATCDPSKTSEFSMTILDGTGAKAFDVNSGNFSLSSTATVFVDSNASNAAVVEGSTGGTSASNATVKAVGGTSGNFTGTSPKSGLAPKNDPYSAMTVPSTTGLTTYKGPNSDGQFYPDGSGNITLQPGYYPKGLYVTNGGNVTLKPGLYYVANGNLWINTTGTVTTDTSSGVGGVTMFHAGTDSTALLHTQYGIDAAIVLCPTDGNYTISAPTSGTYQGISLYQGPNCTQQAFYDFWGAGSLNLGTQYFPNSTLRAWAKNGTINSNELVAKDFKLNGTHEIYGTSQNGGFSKLTWNATPTTSPNWKDIALVE